MNIFGESKDERYTRDVDVRKLRKSSAKIFKLTPSRILVLGFISLILLGTFLLMLPVSTNSGEHTEINEAMFTSISAVCVTGLVVVDTNVHWTLFGKIVIIFLIQTGGLGIMLL